MKLFTPIRETAIAIIDIACSRRRGAGHVSVKQVGFHGSFSEDLVLASTLAQASGPGCLALSVHTPHFYFVDMTCSQIEVY